MALRKKLKQAKAQLEEAAKPPKRKISNLERKLFFWPTGVLSFLDLKKRQAPIERDLPTAKRLRKLSKRQFSTRLRASEEDKQVLNKQLTNAHDMVKKPEDSKY